MSLSNPQSSTSPVEMYVTWKGSDGHFSAYNTEAGADEVLGNAIGFVVLDKRSTVVGFMNDKPIRANIVKQGEELSVRTADGQPIAQGNWGDIGDTVKSKGGKYCLYLYVMLITKSNEKKLAVLKIYGSGFGNWIDLKYRDGDGRIIKALANKEAQKKGGVTFFSPVYSFSTKENKEAYHAAFQMDKELQAYFAGKNDEAPQEFAEAQTAEVQSDNDVDDLPF